MLGRAVIVGIIIGASGSAFALKPGGHADIAKTSCTATGLGRDLCQRIATEDYNTDGNEWDDLRAHAQIDDGQTACVAADATADRLWRLGSELRAQLSTFASSNTEDNAGNVDALIGRALHTIQDDCAHHGMPNPQHAWFSMGDFCDGTASSPDVQDDAIACARVETDAAMRVVADAIRSAGLASQLAERSCPPTPENDASSNQPAVCDRRFLPGPFDACGFLGRARDWDGIDRTWNNAVVTPALRAAFAAGLASEPAPVSMCHGDESVLSNASSQPIVDVSAGAPSCVKASVFCLGKADDPTENPFADHSPEAGGCAAGGASGTAIPFVIVALGWARRRRPGARTRRRERLE